MKMHSFETKSLKEKLGVNKEMVNKFKFDKNISTKTEKPVQHFSERSSFKLKSKRSPILKKMFNCSKSSYPKQKYKIKKSLLNKKLNSSIGLQKSGKINLSKFFNEKSFQQISGYYRVSLQQRR